MTFVAQRRLGHLAVWALLALGATLAATSLVQDSVTWDETSHLTSGYSYLRTGDFRLAPDHPPLAKMWAALPIWLMGANGSVEATFDWHTGNVWGVGRAWLFHDNDGQKLIVIARAMIVVLLLCTYGCIYWIARGMLGAGAALLALTIAVLCPTLLAHGRLVTTDLPATLLLWVTLGAYVRVLERLTVGRVALGSVSLAALSLTKFSWPLIIPVLALLGVWAVLRARPWRVSGWVLGERWPGGLRTRSARMAAVAVVALCGALTTWLGIWTVYGWQYTPFRGADRTSARMLSPTDSTHPVYGTMDEVWQSAGVDAAGAARHDMTTMVIAWARGRQLLPEAYLFGLAYTNRSMLERGAYLLGEHANTGWYSYFPIAFLIKTPLATMGLMLLGIAGLVVAPRRRGRLMLVGLILFSATIAGTAIFSRLNIGHRHILPLYPAVAIVAGAAWRLRRRAIRVLVALLIGWLAVANARANPDYLSYFNELIGGSENAHHYLADSNLDWGQDLLRLKHWVAGRPAENIMVAVSASADPRFYVPQAGIIGGAFDFGQPPALTAGTYVISATELVGVYDISARDRFWAGERNRRAYRERYELIARHRSGAEKLPMAEFNEMQEQLISLQTGWLINQLRTRKPDERVGRSLFVYHLTQRELEDLLKPP